jgi:hypothetical protein
MLRPVGIRDHHNVYYWLAGLWSSTSLVNYYNMPQLLVFKYYIKSVHVLPSCIENVYEKCRLLKIVWNYFIENWNKQSSSPAQQTLSCEYTRKTGIQYPTFRRVNSPRLQPTLTYDYQIGRKPNNSYYYLRWENMAVHWIL